MTPRETVKAVCAHRGITIAQLFDPLKSSCFVSRVRFECQWLLSRVCGLSLPVLVKFTGRYDHTSALYGIRRIKTAIKADPSYEASLRAIVAPRARQEAEYTAEWLAAIGPAPSFAVDDKAAA